MLMLGTAIFFDTLQIFLNFILIGIVLNPILVTPLASLTFYLWYKIKGVGLSDSAKRFAVFLTGFFIELIPILNILPGLILSTLVMITIVRAEDKAENTKNKLKIAAQEKQLKKAEQERNVRTQIQTQKEAVERKMENKEEERYYRDAANDNKPSREKLVA